MQRQSNQEKMQGEILSMITYTVHEINPPQGMKPVQDFEVTISEEGQTFYYLLEDKQIVSPVRLVKKMQ